MDEPDINMRFLKKSRKQPRTGDVFVFQMKTQNHYHYGRVIRTDTRIGNLDNVIMVYIYKNTSSIKERVPELKKEDLLIPPVGIFSNLWTKGFFETIENRPLTSDEVHKKHCFHDLARDWYFDESGERLKGRIEPCGTDAVTGYGALDQKVSRALGMSNPPSSEDHPKGMSRIR